MGGGAVGYCTMGRGSSVVAAISEDDIIYGDRGINGGIYLIRQSTIQGPIRDFTVCDNAVCISHRIDTRRIVL